MLSDIIIANRLAKAYALAATSKDKSNQNGAILLEPTTLEVIGEGANNFPPLVEFNEARATKRPMKYHYFEHAERWAVYDAARKGNRVEGSHMVCPWAACCDCARSLIVAGVTAVYLHQQRMEMTPDRWKDDVNEALNMLYEAGVFVHYFDGPVFGPRVIVNGIEWEPSDQPFGVEYGNWAIGMRG
jgi:dCMP deaminase